MAFTDQDISRLARLSGLQLGAAEAPALQQDLNRILGLIEELQAVDTSGVQPMAHPMAGFQDISLRLCADEPEPTQDLASRDAAMANAPAVHEGLFLVPTVIE